MVVLICISLLLTDDEYLSMGFLPSTGSTVNLWKWLLERSALFLNSLHGVTRKISLGLVSFFIFIFFYLLVNIFIIVFPFKFIQNKQKKKQRQWSQKECTIRFSYSTEILLSSGNCAVGFSFQ